MKTIEIMDEIEQVLGNDYALDTNNEKVYVVNGNVYEYWSDYYHEEGITEECIIGIRLISDYVNANG